MVRNFSTGANRNSEEGKLDYEGFLSPTVLKRYAEFMHEMRHLEDGTYRDSDNWQKGIPKDAYMKSMARHYMDVWLHHRGQGKEATEPQLQALTALLFNVMGYIFELEKHDIGSIGDLND